MMEINAYAKSLSNKQILTFHKDIQVIRSACTLECGISICEQAWLQIWCYSLWNFPKQMILFVKFPKKTLFTAPPYFSNCPLPFFLTSFPWDPQEICLPAQAGLTRSPSSRGLLSLLVILDFFSSNKASSSLTSFGVGTTCIPFNSWRSTIGWLGWIILSSLTLSASFGWIPFFRMTWCRIWSTPTT